MPFALVAPLLVALVGAVVKPLVERKPKLITYLVHATVIRCPLVSAEP